MHSSDIHFVHGKYHSARMNLSRSARLMRLYRFALSGHCHRVEVFLTLLGIPFVAVDVDLAGGAHREPEFLRMNPFGQVPVLEDGDTVVADANAILVYLAMRYGAGGSWLPRAPREAAEVQRWLSAAASELAHGPALARVGRLFGGAVDRARVELLAGRLFGAMEATLAERTFLVGSAPTVADLALYGYTARANEGDLSLDPYPRIAQWLARLEALPGFVPMPRVA